MNVADRASLRSSGWQLICELAFEPVRQCSMAYGICVCFRMMIQSCHANADQIRGDIWLGEQGEFV